MPTNPFSVKFRTQTYGAGYMRNTGVNERYTNCAADPSVRGRYIRPSNNTWQCQGCGGYKSKCLTKGSRAYLETENKRITGAVRVAASAYMSERAALTGFAFSRGIQTQRQPAGTWNQSSDRMLKHVGTAVVPSRGSSVRSSLTRNRPGAGAPGGAGVDIKHNCYARYLARKKGNNIRGGPYVADRVAPGAVVNNKVQKASISAFCYDYACVCGERETVTLAAARAQGGLRDCQDLVLTGDDYVERGNNVYGLLIEDGQTFTVAPTATITFADPIAAAGTGAANGIRVDTGGAFRQEGGAITFRGDITSTAGAAVGIENGGTFTQAGGAITFEGAITGDNGFGILNSFGTFRQAGGAITFNGDIGGYTSNRVIENNSTGTFIQEGGAITFNGDIGGDTITNNCIINSATFTQAGGAITINGAITGNNNYGIINFNGTFTQAGGAITFEGAITSTAVAGTATGIINSNTFTQAGGAITFRGAITSAVAGTATGIFNSNTFTQAGTITFEGLLVGGAVFLVDADNADAGSFTVNGAIAFPGTEYVPANFVPTTANDDRFTGNGTITYNNDDETPDTYYPVP
jgi:hypothetical protein